MNNIILRKWLTYIDNQFIDNDFIFLTCISYSNKIFISNDTNSNNISYIIEYIIDNKIIDNENYIVLLISTFILLKKLTQKHIFYKNMLYNTIIGLFIICEKMNNDLSYDNYTWSQITQIPLSKINKIESTLLYNLDFNIFINEKEFLSISQILYI